MTELTNLSNVLDLTYKALERPNVAKSAQETLEALRSIEENNQNDTRKPAASNDR